MGFEQSNPLRRNTLNKYRLSSHALSGSHLLQNWQNMRKQNHIRWISEEERCQLSLSNTSQIEHIYQSAESVPTTDPTPISLKTSQIDAGSSSSVLQLRKQKDPILYKRREQRFKGSDKICIGTKTAKWSFNCGRWQKDGRNRIKTCVSNLRKANLLIVCDYPGCVKMHNLVLAFVLATVSKGDHASIINHGDMLNRSSEDMRGSCKRISLTCRGTCEFPEGFSCPNLSLLKLMHGDDSFKFPQGFYENTEKLEVIAYEEMQYPLLPRSLQCSTNLRMLCLHGCSLMFDCSFIGDLSNLEVLNITKCDIRKLPSTFGKLKKLKVLDLTGCLDLIDDGILKRLVKLGELYMVVSYKTAIRFTDANVDELVGCSKNLTALAIEFNSLPKNISFKKLERFKISLGCYLDKFNDQSSYLFENKLRYQGGYMFENALRLVTNKHELLDSRMSRLFDKTEVLYLQVNGVNDLEEGLAEPLHHHHRSSFNYLIVLDILKCTDLRYLFTASVANGLKKLERLTISLCPVLETVVDGNKGGVGVVKFQALKFLSLDRLPKLKSLCNVVDVIELPQLVELQLSGLPNFISIYPLATSSMSHNISERQSFFNEEVVIPNLEKLEVFNLVIWPCQFGSSKKVNACKLREFSVIGCNRLVNLFPTNPMSLMYHLEDLIVKDCSSIGVLFNIDMGCVHQTEEVGSCLRNIKLWHLSNLREVWRIKGANDIGLAFSGFQAIERLKIEINVMSNEEISEVGDTIPNVAFPSHLLHTCRNLRTLCIEKVDLEVVFEIETPSSRELATTLQNTQQVQLLPNLEELYIREMECMSHVWKCNWNKFLIPHKQQPEESSSSFRNLTVICLQRCENIKYLFSPLMAILLPNLLKVVIIACYVIEEVVSNRDDDEDEGRIASTNTSLNLFPYLDALLLYELPKIKRIGGGTTTICDQFKKEKKEKEEKENVMTR
ncbi:hypothetical protein L6452_08470 [Arctium lappa]|uniref:Uncharacterized protein n=1 Tax=Arctium lappa TaxID=4217 RepID=A0ACB9DIG6_ARCLA|nr:hypothetical protein L6452_08470 [Arctium lappa]